MSRNPPTTADLLAHAAWVRALSLELVRDGGAAEDLAQETLLRALKSPPREAGALRAFLARVLRNARTEERRGAARRRERERRAARPEAQAGAAELSERLSTHRRLVEAVERLEEPFRAAVLLRFFEELPPRAIAARLGVPIKTVDSRLQRGLARLRADLDERGGGRRAWAAALLELVRAGEAPAAAPLPAPALARAALALGGAALLGAAGWALLRGGGPRDVQEVRVADVGAAADATAPGAELRAGAGAEGGSERRPLAASELALLRGAVRDAAGAPVAGARVEALDQPLAGFDLGGVGFEDAERPLASAAADAEGRFALEVPADVALGVRAGAPGFGPARLAFARAGEELALVLERAAGLDLQAWCGDAPAAGAAVELLLQGVHEPVWRGATDERGALSARGLSPGIYTVQATPLDGPRTFALDIALRPGETVPVELRSAPGARLRGRVAAEDGRPVAGARVTGSRSAPASSDGEGRFELRGLPPDPAGFPTWTVSVQAPGYAPQDARVDAAAPPEELLLALAPEARLRGELVDAGGHPLRDAFVICGGQGARSDAQGHFDLGGLPRGRPLALWVRAPSCGTWTGVLEQGAAGELDLGRIALASAVSLAGRARTSAGEGVAGAMVELQRLSPPVALGPRGEPLATGAATPASGAPATTVVIRVAAQGPASAPAPSVAAPPTTVSPLALELERCGARHVRADAAGAFRCDDLAPGRYRVLARKNGLEPVAPLELELAAGAPPPPVDLVFDAGLVLSGVVHGSDGAPLANAWLMVRGAARGPAQLSGLDGAFALYGLKGGALDLEVSYHATDAGGEPLYLRAWSRGLRPPCTGVEVVLPRNLPVEGVLLGEDGAPLSGITVKASDGDGRITTAATDAQGRFRVGAAEGWSVDLALAAPELSAELPGVAAGATGVVLRARAAR